MTNPGASFGNQGYSRQALSEHDERVRQFAAALEVSSRTIARQKNTDDVQREHVMTAGSALAPGVQKDSYKWVLDLSLLLAGFGLGYLGNVILADNKFSVANLLIIAIPLAVGAVLYSFALGRRG